jgi:hypothetical protein
MRRFPRLFLGVVLLVGLLAVVVSPVSAVTPRRTWNATIGSSRLLGSATLVLLPSYTGSIRVSVQGLNPSTTYAAMIYKGTCGSPTALVRLPGIRTDSSGNGTRTTSLNLSAGASIWNTARAGSIAIRVASGSTAYCAKLTYPLATRIQIARFGINLPIVAEPNGIYPYCNVAMYMTALSQPGEAGPTFIYAHARTGMFLPLLTASQTNASGMVGMTVQVWTSDSLLHTYRITRVLRFQYSLPAYSSGTEELMLQTSEGPHGTPHKLFLIGTQVSVTNASYADAHPTPHIVVCGF